MAYFILKLLGCQCAINGFTVGVKHTVGRHFTRPSFLLTHVAVDEYKAREDEKHSTKLSNDKDDLNNKPEATLNTKYDPV